MLSHVPSSRKKKVAKQFHFLLKFLNGNSPEIRNGWVEVVPHLVKRSNPKGMIIDVQKTSSKTKFFFANSTQKLFGTQHVLKKKIIITNVKTFFSFLKS